MSSSRTMGFIPMLLPLCDELHGISKYASSHGYRRVTFSDKPFNNLRNASMLLREIEMSLNPAAIPSGSQFREFAFSLKCVVFLLPSSTPIPSLKKNEDPKSLPPRDVIRSAGAATPGELSGPTINLKPPGLMRNPCFMLLYSAIRFPSRKSLANRYQSVENEPFSLSIFSSFLRLRQFIKPDSCSKVTR